MPCKPLYRSTHALYSHNFALEGAIFALEAPYLLFALLLMSDILAACKAIIETGIHKANKEVDNCLASQVLFAHDMVINHLVSNATPSFTSLLPDP